MHNGRSDDTPVGVVRSQRGDHGSVDLVLESARTWGMSCGALLVRFSSASALSEMQGQDGASAEKVVVK